MVVFEVERSRVCVTKRPLPPAMPQVVADDVQCCVCCEGALEQAMCAQALCLYALTGTAHVGIEAVDD